MAIMANKITGTKLTMGEAYLDGTRRAVTQIALSQEVKALPQPGTILKIQGTTKGKGFAGVVKRWGFGGGFKTHGQSDRWRAPGSIGQGTTPGRVHKGKKMPGRMGGTTHTVKNSLVVAVKDHFIWVTGPVPGNTGSSLTLTQTGQKDAPTLSFLTGGLPQQPEETTTATSPEDNQ
jgi:50S ribosomal protein uL3